MSLIFFNIKTSIKRYTFFLILTALFMSGCASNKLQSSLPLEKTSVDTPLANETKIDANNYQKENDFVETNKSETLFLGKTNFILPKITQGQPTGTFVGEQVKQLREGLMELQAVASKRNELLQAFRKRVIKIANSYHSTIAFIESRLQTGTTPGNPILINRWNSTQAYLERVASEVGYLQKLGNEVAADSAMSQFLLEKARSAKNLQGAMDEDHKQISILQDEINKTVVVIERLLNELRSDIRRQTSYIANEQSNLQTLSLAITNGELYGTSLANRYMTASNSKPFQDPEKTKVKKNRPLVTIKFDIADLSYEQGLYTALANALETQQNAHFHLISVAPGGGSAPDIALASQQGQRYTNKVFKSMVDIGIPAELISISSTTDLKKTVHEVQVFVE